VQIADMGQAAPINGCSCPKERHNPSNKRCKGKGLLYNLAGTESYLAPELRTCLGQA